MWTLFLILLIPLIYGCLFMVILFSWLIFQSIRGWKQKPLASYPKVAIVVPHYNENPEHLLQALESFEEQDYQRQLLVMLVDDGSTNGIQTPLQEWLSQPRKQEYRSLRFEQNNGSKGKALDAALPSIPADVEAMVVVDSDTFLEPQSVRRVVERMWQDEKCAAVCGFILPANAKGSLIGKLQYFEHIGVYPAVKCAQDMMGCVSVMAGAFVIHRMSAVRKVGGWSRWIVEDIAWTWSALAHGYTTGYAPEAVAYTYCPTTREGLLKQRRRWARGRTEAFRAAWSVSPLKGMILTPFYLLWVTSLLPPTICLTPALAIAFGQWWVFGVIAICFALYVAMFELYQRRLPQRLRKGMGDIMRSTYYNTVFELVLWHPNFQGFWDEMVGRRKIWLTRQ